MTRSLAVAAVALLFVSCQSQQAPAGETIAIASDEGPANYAPGVTWEHAIRFAIQRAGRVGEFNLVYRPYDVSLGGEQNALRGHENVERAIEDTDVLGIVGPFSTSLSLAELPDGNHARLAMVSPTATGNCLTFTGPTCSVPLSYLQPTGSVTFFRLAPTDFWQGRATAAFAIKNGLRSVAIFNEFGEGGGLPYITGFRDVFEQSGGKVVLVEDLLAGTTSFSTFLGDARRRGADAVYAIAQATDGACLAALQMKTLLPGAAFLANDGITFDPQCIKDAGTDAAEGIVATFPDVDPTSSAALKQNPQVQAYLKAYPKPSDVDEYTFAAYDATNLLIDAIRRAIKQNNGGRPSRQQVVGAVAAENYTGVTGTYSFDANGDAKSPLMSIYRVEGGKWVRIGP